LKFLVWANLGRVMSFEVKVWLWLFLKHSITLAYQK
jgi:hypothetical protein